MAKKLMTILVPFYQEEKKHYSKIIISCHGLKFLLNRNIKAKSGSLEAIIRGGDNLSFTTVSL